MAGKNAVTAPDAKKRRAIYNSMPTPLQEVADVLAQKFVALVKGGILIDWDVGELVHKVAAGEAVFGVEGVQQLADYFNKKATTLYALRDFATSFERDYVQEWTSQSMEDGNFLTTSHWLALRQLAKVEDREKMLKKALKESWSAQELESEVRSGAHPRKNVRSGGRKPSAPTSPLAGLQKFSKLALALTNYEETAETHIFDTVDEVSPDNVNDTLLEKLRSTRKSVVDATGKLESATERIDGNIERVESIIKQKAEDAEKTAEEAKKAGANGEDTSDKSGKGKPTKGKKTKGKKKGKSRRPTPATTTS